MSVELLDDGDLDDGTVIEQGEPSAEAARAQTVAMLPVSKRGKADQYRILKGWITADLDFSRDWRAQAKMWFEFRAGDHWTPDDKALLEEAGRPVIVFNRVLTILKAVAGMEINGRHETAFLPRGTEDVKANEVLSAASKWMADECDGEDEESQAFDDCATCGMGWVEERMSYEDEPDGLYVEEKMNPLEMGWDRTARKKNLSDSRRMWRIRKMAFSDASSIFPGFTREQMNAGWADEGGLDYPQKSLEQKWKRDNDNVLDPTYDDLDEVTIVQVQWIEKEPYWIVADEANNRKAELSEAEYRVFEKRMTMFGMKPVAVRHIRKVFKQAFLGAEGVMLREAADAPMRRQFSWKCVTGEIDAIKGTWFGLVKVMRDPQMWANKWMSQILHILNSTAKGGILAELSAFDDERDAEDSYAQADEITWLADGALSGDKPKVMEKPGRGDPSGYMNLLTFAVAAIPQVVGINLELLGQQDVNQPGVLEAMRKQAGMTVLATLFDSLRRFRKLIGRGRLFFIQTYLSDGRLIRVTGPEGAQAVSLAKDKTVGLYDVVVDATPTSPNQKEANWLIIQPMLAAFRDQLVANPQIFALLLEYSPLPARIVDAIKELIRQQENDPQAQQEKQENRALFVNTAIAKINKDQSTAEMQNAKAGASQATAIYDVAMARNMMEDNLRAGQDREAQKHFENLKLMLQAQDSAAKQQESKAKAIKTIADARHTSAKTDRERAGAVTDVMKARSESQATEAGGHRERIGAMIDGLVGTAQARRHHAGAEKDLAAARLTNRTPAPLGAR